MSHPNKKKGYRWEKEILPFLEKVWPDIKRTGSARQDRADFESALCPFVIEAKDDASFNISGWLEQAARARDRLGFGWPVVVVKRRRHPTPKAYVVMELATFLEVGQELGQLEDDNMDLMMRLEQAEE